MSEALGLPTLVEHDGRLRMYFVGTERTSNAYVSRIRVGLAESADGRTFEIINDRKPVFGEGPEGSFDSHSVSHPFVLPVPADDERAAGDAARSAARIYYMYCDAVHAARWCPATGMAAGGGYDERPRLKDRDAA